MPHMTAHQALNQRCHWASAAEQARLAVEHAQGGQLRSALGGAWHVSGALVRGPDPAEVLARELDRLDARRRIRICSSSSRCG